MLTQLRDSLDKTLFQTDALESYFLSEFEDNDETKDNDKVNQEVCFIRKFNDPFTKLYLLFVQSAIPAFDIYNTFLQSEEPFVHLLHKSTLNLYKTLLVRFIKPHITAHSIDTEDSTNYKESSFVHIGFFTKHYALFKDLAEASKYTKFLKEVQKFYFKICSYLLK